MRVTGPSGLTSITGSGRQPGGRIIGVPSSIMTVTTMVLSHPRRAEVTPKRLSILTIRHSGYPGSSGRTGRL